LRAETKIKTSLDFSHLLTGRGPNQSRLRVAAGEVVCAQGAHQEALYYIEEGRVKLSAVSPNGKEAVLAIRGPHNFFGTRCLIDRHRRGADAVTLTNCLIVRVARSAAIKLLRSEPDFAEMFIAYLAQQIMRDQQNLADQLTDSSERRLARALLRLAGDDGNQKSQPIVARVSQADLASMIGTTRPRVSYFMNKFRKQGFVEYKRQGDVTVHKALSKTLHDS
jgi:CRP/FNR family transcriptional regulator, cyclic AMP receptor protein